MQIKSSEKIRSELSVFLRLINCLNPTSHGRHWIESLAKKWRMVPQDGIYKLQCGIMMELHMDDFIERSVYFDSFEFLYRRVLLRYLKPGGIFIDIGANVGYYTLIANHEVGSNGRVLSFEPNPDTLEKLKRNISLNSAMQVEVFEMALSDADSEVTLFCPNDETHGCASMVNQGWDDASIHKVMARRLDDVLPQEIDHIDLIKMDVEGAELKVVRGARRTISKYRPTILLELSEKATKSFGHDTLNVPKLLLEYNPNYKMKFIDTHTIKKTTLDELYRHNMRNGNLLMY
ncbi:MAG: hypothetical protein COC05_04060 [Gammaproteobacteria bacterium]|nr:FkbM family methyltransferase [bacterium AH-315-E07]PCH60595.1 MAG: hypothetical protein COC05_04060 [Gammaproteobacteria bacterium]